MKDDKTFNDADESTSRRRRDRVKREEEYEEDVDIAQDENDEEEEEYEVEDDDQSYDEDEDGEYDEDGEEEEDDGDEYDEEDYDDDVFSLEEDLKREQRKQFIQYICIAVAAVAIIAFALFASVKLTQKRVEDEQNAAIIAQEAVKAQQEATKTLTGEVAAPIILSDWPTSEFPDVPRFEAEDYQTTVRDGYAKISVPSSATSGYDAYIDSLTSGYGATVYLKTPKLCVLRMDDVEIHLCSGNQQNRVVLCDEKEIQFGDVDYRAFDLPTGFKLVSASADSAMGRVLTYRLASVDKALEYANSLVSQYGWKIAGSFDMADQTFYAVYAKNNLQMTLDYYSSSDDFTIKLDYVN